MLLKTVFLSSNPLDAQVVHALLIGNGINAFIENEFGNLLGLALQGPLSSIRVTVEESQESEALKLIRNRSAPSQENSSERSGYVLMPCASCGKQLETEGGEEAPEECPWCGKPPTGKA